MTKEEEKFISSLHLQRGLTIRQAAQLIFNTNFEPENGHSTSHPDKRFSSWEAFEEWSKQRKVIYTLVDKSNNLLGIIWFSIEKPDIGITYTTKLYSLARDRGTISKFISSAVADFVSSGEYENLTQLSLGEFRKSN